MLKHLPSRSARAHTSYVDKGPIRRKFAAPRLSPAGSISRSIPYDGRLRGTLPSLGREPVDAGELENPPPLGIHEFGPAKRSGALGCYPHQPPLPPAPEGTTSSTTSVVRFPFRLTRRTFCPKHHSLRADSHVVKHRTPTTSIAPQGSQPQAFLCIFAHL